MNTSVFFCGISLWGSNVPKLQLHQHVAGIGGEVEVCVDGGCESVLGQVPLLMDITLKRNSD